MSNAVIIRQLSSNQSSTRPQKVVVLPIDPEKLRPSQLKALGLPIHGRAMRPKPMPVQGWFPSTHSSGSLSQPQNFKQLKAAVQQIDSEKKALKKVKDSGETTCWLSPAVPDFHASQGCCAAFDICTIQDAQLQGRKPCTRCWN